MSNIAFLRNYFKQSLVGQNIEKLLAIFKSEKGVLEFCLMPVEESEMTDEEKLELKDVIEQSLKELFSELRKRKGEEILKQVNF